MDVIESKSLDRDAGETRFPLFLIPLWTMIASREIAHGLDLFVLTPKSLQLFGIML